LLGPSWIAGRSDLLLFGRRPGSETICPFHKTIRKELLADRRFPSLEQAKAELDAWVGRYNAEREHQAIGDVAPIRRFELAATPRTEAIDPDPPCRSSGTDQAS
jgi:transposase InsO family protein